MTAPKLKWRERREGVRGNGGKSVRGSKGMRMHDLRRRRKVSLWCFVVFQTTTVVNGSCATVLFKLLFMILRSRIKSRS